MTSVRALFSGAASRISNKSCGSLLECSAFKRSVAVCSPNRSCFAVFFLGTVLLSTGSAALTLAQAEQELLGANTDIALAEAGVEGASANVTVAGQLPNPTLSVQSTQYSPITGLGAGRPTDKALDTIVGISLPLERGDKAALRREAATEQLAGARHDLRDTRRQQRLALHQAYYDLKLAEEKQELAAQTKDIAAQALAAADKRVAAGDLAAVDRYRLAVEALRTANDANSAEADVRQARLGLAVLLGRKREGMDATGPRGEIKTGDLTASDPWPERAPAVAAEAGVNARADVAAAEARLAAAGAGRSVARSLRTRDVTVGAQIERQPASSAGVTFGINVSFPLYARYGFEGEIARAEADYTTALLTRQKVVSLAEAEVERAAVALEGSRQRLASFESEIVPAAKKALDAIEFAYTRGAAGLTDALDARRTWRATQVDLAVAQADHAKALAGWRAATEWESARP
jgi:cobalt-zinc-cadmium efflux system outer membrane protein